MGVQQPAFTSLILVGMWVTSCLGGEGQNPAETWGMRLTGFGCRCSGLLEVKPSGSWSRVCSSVRNQITKMVCAELGCGSPSYEVLKLDSRPKFMERMTPNCQANGTTLRNCRWEKANCTQDVTVVCKEPEKTTTVPPPPTTPEPTGFQPRVMRRLGDSQSPCEGVMKVFHNGKWEVLCDSSSWKKSREEQVCQELQCGKLSLSVQVPGAKTWGVSCSQEHLQECSTFKRTTCSKTRITCQNFKPAGVGAGTIVSILLALILLGVLIIICGPPAYKKLQKKYAKKQQRQWIGPTGLQQNVSFHRNSTVTLRPRQEGQGAQGEDNDYSQTPKKNSYLSAYPALEGAIRSSNPPDNSSDSDYDLHSARRL
ncbi:T-cell surface glycoprotein CD5 isoform 3-T3 [Pangshura tecta]